MGAAFGILLVAAVVWAPDAGMWQICDTPQHEHSTHILMIAVESTTLIATAKRLLTLIHYCSSCTANAHLTAD